jgi:drug/metabolite transporter (DMT)-like permease
LLGVLQLGLSYALYSVAIKYVTALEAILITTIEPILNPIWVFLLIGEQPGPWSLAGGVIIIAAIIGRYILPGLKSLLPVNPRPR